MQVHLMPKLADWIWKYCSNDTIILSILSANVLWPYQRVTNCFRSTSVAVIYDWWIGTYPLDGFREFTSSCAFRKDAWCFFSTNIFHLPYVCSVLSVVRVLVHFSLIEFECTTFMETKNEKHIMLLQRVCRKTKPTPFVMATKIQTAK